MLRVRSEKSSGSSSTRELTSKVARPQPVDEFFDERSMRPASMISQSPTVASLEGESAVPNLSLGGWIVAACVGLAVASWSAPSLAQPPPREPLAGEAKLAAEQFERGKALFAQNKLQEALDAFREAYRLDPRPMAHLANLGTTESALGLHRDAAEHLARALDRVPLFGEGEHARRRNALQAALARVTPEVGALRLDVSPRGATVLADGRPVEHIVMVDLYFEPGRHRITAQAPGFVEASIEVELQKGERKEAALDLKSVRPEPTMAPTKTRNEPPPDSHVTAERGAPPALLIAGATLVVAGSVTGVAGTLMANEGAADVERLHAALPSNSACVSPTGDQATQCAELSDAVDAEDTGTALAIGGFATAGAALTATVLAHLLWPRDSPPTGATLAPMRLPGGAGLRLGSTF